MNKIVESRPPQGNHHVALRVAVLLLILGLAVMGLLLLLMLVDTLRGHPGATWHLVMGWFDALKPWLIASGAIALVAKVVLPHLEARHQTALPRAEAAVKRAEAKRIKHETCILRELHDHNMENLPPVFFHKPDANGNFAQPIGPDGRPVAFLLPGNTAAGNSGIPAKMVLDYLQQQNAVEGEYYEEEDAPAQIEEPKKILLSQQIECDLTVTDEDESVFGYPIDTHEPFRVPLFRKEGNFVDSVFVIGIQGQGKSTVGTYFAGLTVNHGGHLLVIDPDAQEDQSISNRLGSLKQFLLMEVADTPEKAERLLTLAEEEIDHPSDFPLLLLVDEFSMIMRHKQLKGKWQEVADKVANTVENYATRGRKRRRRAVVFGQISNASRTGGTELRDSCAYIIFNTPMRKAALVLQDASDEDIETLAPSLTPGMAIVSPARSSDTYVMQFTFPDDRGLRIIAEVRSETDELMGNRPRLRVLPRPGNGTDRDSDFERSTADLRDRGLVPQDTDFLAYSGEYQGTSPEVPRVPSGSTNRLVEPVPTSPAFVPREDDKIVPEHMYDDLAYYYAKLKDVKNALHSIGLSNRYFRHASWVLEDRGLKARKA